MPVLGEHVGYSFKAGTIYTFDGSNDDANALALNDTLFAIQSPETEPGFLDAVMIVKDETGFVFNLYAGEVVVLYQKLQDDLTYGPEIVGKMTQGEFNKMFVNLGG